MSNSEGSVGLKRAIKALESSDYKLSDLPTDYSHDNWSIWKDILKSKIESEGDFLALKKYSCQLNASPQRISNEDLDAIIAKNDKRRDSLEKERKEEKDNIPSVEENDRDILGSYLKFVNRDTSINSLLNHAAEQYALYAQDKDTVSPTIQWAACSGGPGLGKTTFCRKGFTRSVTADSEQLWEGIPTTDSFHPVVKSCVNKGRQYQISFGGVRGGQLLRAEEFKDPQASFSYRLLNCLTKGMPRSVPFNQAPELQDFLEKLTNGTKESLIFVNFDETNKIFDYGEAGKNYLMTILSAVEAFNRRQLGFVYCIMSGTNVRDLHDTLKAASSGNPPKEIPLPLLEIEHMTDILEDLAGRINRSSINDNGNGTNEEEKKEIEIEYEHTKPSVNNATVGDDLKFVLSVLGGVPRYIEVLVFLLGTKSDTNRFMPLDYVDRLSSSKDRTPHNLLTGTRKMIYEQYGSTFRGIMDYATSDYAGNVWPALVSASLFRWPVVYETRFGEYTVRELEKEGILFVKSTRNNSDDALTIEFPLLLMSYILDKSWNDVPSLLRYFDMPMSPDENERNTLAILALMCQGLRVLKKPITVSNLLPGYAPGLSWGDEPLEFDHVKLEQMANQITLKTWSTFEEQIKNEGLHGFFVNAKGSEFSDTLIIPKNSEYVVLIQEKQVEDAKNKLLNGRSVPKFNYTLVEEEHSKCDIEKSHLFIIVSDKAFDENDRSKIKENEIVLPWNEHEKAIGPLLALLRRHNHDFQSKVRLPVRKAYRKRKVGVVAKISSYITKKLGKTK